VPKVSPMQTSFGGGEFSPLLNGQVDLDRYKQALEICENYIPSLQGGLVRRSGTKFVAEAKNAGTAARLVPFEFSTTQAYILEFGDQYIRFFRDNGQIVSGMAAYEIASPYLAADLFELRFTQSADVLYIVHPGYAPRTLSRYAHTNWVLAEPFLQDGPYLPINATAYSLTPSAATGNGVTLIASGTISISGAANNGSGGIRITTAAPHGFADQQKISITGVTGTTEANGEWRMTYIGASTFDLQNSTFVHAYTAGGTIFPAIFNLNDVGRLVRLREGSNWGWFKITAVGHGGFVTGDVVVSLTNTNPKTFWRLGVWSPAEGYPACVTFHEDRLFFGGATNAPQRIDASAPGDYNDFAPSDLAGVVTASDALSFVFNANDVNAVRWIISDEKGLLVGTAGGEWLVRPSSQGEALTPTNITAKRSTKYGSANVQAVQFGKSVLFLQKAGRKVRELAYYFDADGFRAADLTLLAEHITKGGIVEMSTQNEPQPILWSVRADGTLAALTYERDSDSFKVGWHRHVVGGRSDAAGTQAQVESVAVIPSSDGTSAELWLLIKRYIDGAVVRHVEYMMPMFDDETEQKDAFFVDAGLTYDDPVTISAITRANPAVVTANSHGYSNGDKVLFSEILGLINDSDNDETSDLNDMSFLIKNKTANTFEITDLDGTNIDTSGYDTAYVSGGKVRKYIQTISGLDHLEGETVDILADGAVQPSRTVSSGSITLAVKATTVQIGYGFASRGKMLRLNAGAADGTAIGKTQRTHRMGIMLHRSLGLKIGTSFESLTELTFRTASDKMGRATALFTGIKSEELEGDYDFENQFCFEQSQPLPSMVLALMPQMHTQDR